MKYKYIFFDFDGTVADTKEGIYDSAEYTLAQFGISTDKETLHKFVGPTLWHSFETLFASRNSSLVCFRNRKGVVEWTRQYKPITQSNSAFKGRFEENIFGCRN